MGKTPPTRTYPNQKAALAGERALAAKGQITKSDLARVTKQIKSGKKR